MNRLISIILIGLFLIPVILAGETVRIDFRDATAEAVKVSQGDRIILTYFDREQVFIINEVKNSSVAIGIFPYALEPSHMKINTALIGKIDLNQDKNDDITVQLYEVQDQKALLIFKELNQSQNQITAKAINISPTISSKNKIIIGSIILLLIILSIAIIKIKKQKFINK